MTDPLAQPLRLPCGAVLPNRLCKAAMTEGLGDSQLRATERHVRLYRAWSEGGAGLHVTGNVMVDRHVIERPGNVAIDPSHPPSVDAEARARLKAWSAAGTVGGNGLWMQISHAGRQSPRYATRQPVGPSDVQLDLMGNYARPRALREDEILGLVQRFAQVAVIARETGFTGVQVHGAHGYLLSSFLSPVTNLRTDAWGGSLENRARFLVEVVHAVRKAVGDVRVTSTLGVACQAAHWEMADANATIASSSSFTPGSRNRALTSNVPSARCALASRRPMSWPRCRMGNTK